MTVEDSDTEETPAKEDSDTEETPTEKETMAHHRVNPRWLKTVSLVTLTAQNAILSLSMRHSRTRMQPDELFMSPTAVVMAEVVKLITCLYLVYLEEGRNVKRYGNALYNTIVKQPLDTILVGVPSLLYTLQNNLLYLSASNLDAATHQVTYQLKILTTAIFAVILLRKKLILTQWLALVVLIAGVIAVQLSNAEEKKVTNEQNRLLGIGSALVACVLSGLAGIYFEKILKGSEISVWMRNVQLSFLSIPLGLITCLLSDHKKIWEKGFFWGYDWYVAYLVVLQACGGLLVALVVKYADNILKGFATSLAIILSCVFSVILFDFQLTFLFVFGAALVICSIFLYGYQPSKPKSLPLNQKI